MRMMTKLKRNLGILALAVVSLGLSACWDGQPSFPPNNTVSASLAQVYYTTAVGQSITVPVTFNTSTGTASALFVNTTSLPAGWSVQSEGGYFYCATISSSGTGCQLNLVYSPTAVTATTSFNLEYGYDNNNDSAEQGTVTINYSATNASYAYVLNAEDGTNASVSSCAINSSGALTDCQANSIGTSITNAAAIAVNGNYAYILYYTGTAAPNLNPMIAQCNINASTGQLSGCNYNEPTGSEFRGDTGYTGITFATFGGTTYAYISGSYFDYQCTLNATTGVINACVNMSQGDLSANSIAFGAVGVDNTLYAYSATTGNSVLNFSINQTSGVFTAANTTSFGTNTTGIAIATVENNAYAYVPNGIDISMCPVNSSNGHVTTSPPCAVQTTGLSKPNKIGINAGTNYAYVLDSADSVVASCPIQTGGGLGTCSSPTSGGTSGAFNTPVGIGFFTP